MHGSIMICSACAWRGEMRAVMVRCWWDAGRLFLPAGRRRSVVGAAQDGVVEGGMGGKAILGLETRLNRSPRLDREVP